MRFTAVCFSAVLALGVLAQNSTIIPVVSGTAPVTPAQSFEAACLAACSVSDLSCKDKCISASNPTNSVAVCQGNCLQGNGTATDNADYKTCIQHCIDTNGGPAVTTTGAATGNPTETGATAGAATGTETGSPTASGGSTGTSTSSGSTTSKSNAADSVRVGASVIGLVGLMAAMVAL